jgi:hypothetical protein
MITDAYVLDYDNEASGPFTEGESLSFSGGATGELIILRDLGATGKMYFYLLSGTLPADNETITGGSSSATANVDGTPFQSRFPLYIRDDTSFNSSSDLRWTGQNLGTTHSCKYDGQTTNLTVGHILTFSGGATAELIAVTDNGATGIIYFRLIGTTIPLDNETFTDEGSGDGVVDGVVSQRCYTPQEIHYWLLDLGDDATYTGNDVQDRTKPRASTRIFTTIVEALGNTNIDDTMSYHMYGGSWSQDGGNDVYSGFDISVVDADGTTEPVIIQNWALLSATTTEYWKNSYMASAAARVRLMVKTRSGGTDIDRKVVRVRALEYLRNYFTAPDVQLGTGVVGVSLVAEDDGNNTTASGTVATWTDVVETPGYQTVDHNNGNGAQPYWLTVDLGAKTKDQGHEVLKYNQRRGTSETLYGHNYQLIVGNDLDIPFDAGSGSFTEGETLTFSNGCTALLLAKSSSGATGIHYCQRMTGDVPSDDDTYSGGTSSETAAVNGTPTTRLITNNIMGVYTGSAFNPANRGITLNADDATTEDLFTDLLGVQQSPPNNQQGTINTSAGNTVIVAPWDGSSYDPAGDAEPDFDYRTVATNALDGAAETEVTVNSAIPSWVPTSGYLRITTNAGVRRLVAYSSWSGSVFTFTSSEDFSSDNANIGNGVMPMGYDAVTATGTAQFTGVYTSPVQMMYKVQNGSGTTPKKPGIGTTTFGSGGFSVNVTLQDDA